MFRVTCKYKMIIRTFLWVSVGDIRQYVCVYFKAFYPRLGWLNLLKVRTLYNVKVELFYWLMGCRNVIGLPEVTLNHYFRLGLRRFWQKEAGRHNPIGFKLFGINIRLWHYVDIVILHPSYFWHVWLNIQVWYRTCDNETKMEVVLVVTQCWSPDSIVKYLRV